MKQEKKVQREGLSIYCVEYLPEQAAGRKLPAIIISHGFGGRSEDSEIYCEAFSGAGYAVYAFDFCGGSCPGTGKSDGRIEDMTIESEVQDLLSVFGMVKALPYIDRNHIALMGMSQGGFVSALAAARIPEEVWGLIPVYPAFCIPDHARLGVLGGARYSLDAVPEILECPNGMGIGRALFDGVVGMDPFLEAGKYHGPVLLMHGTADAVVNYSYSVKLKETYGDACQLQLIDGQGHGFDAAHKQSVADSVLCFLEGKREWLTIRIILTGSEVLERRGNILRRAVFFTGYCDNDLFRGTILPGAADIQTQEGPNPPVLRAEYDLEGVDRAGKKCRIHIVNEKKGDFYRPVIDTDSESLSFLNRACAVAVLDGARDGLNVRIFI